MFSQISSRCEVALSLQLHNKVFYPKSNQKSRIACVEHMIARTRRCRCGENTADSLYNASSRFKINSRKVVIVLGRNRNRERVKLVADLADSCSNSDPFCPYLRRWRRDGRRPPLLGTATAALMENRIGEARGRNDPSCHRMER